MRITSLSSVGFEDLKLRFPNTKDPVLEDELYAIFPNNYGVIVYIYDDKLGGPGDDFTIVPVSIDPPGEITPLGIDLAGYGADNAGDMVTVDTEEEVSEVMREVASRPPAW